MYFLGPSKHSRRLVGVAGVVSSLSKSTTASVFIALEVDTALDDPDFVAGIVPAYHLLIQTLALATTWSLYPDSCFSDHYGRYLLYKKAHFEVAKPKVAIYVLTEVSHGPAGR